MKYDIVDSCLEKIKKNISSHSINQPYFINTENNKEYQEIKEKLSAFLEVIRISTFCKSYDSLPDMENMTGEMRRIKGKVLLLGVSQYIKLYGNTIIYNYLDIFKSMYLKEGKIIILCFQMQNLLMELMNDIRLENRIIFLSAESSKKPHITFINTTLETCKTSDMIIGFKNFLLNQEDLCQSDVKILTQYNSRDLINSVISIRNVENAFDAIQIFDKNIPSQLFYHLGTNEQWLYLLNLIVKYKNFNNVIKSELISENSFHNWLNYDANKKWLYLLMLKCKEAQDTYLSCAAYSAVNVEEFIKNIYQNILDLDYTDKSYRQKYIERKYLIEILKDLKNTLSFCSHAEIKGKDEIFYLTDITDIEKNEIISCLCKYPFNENSLCNELSFVYPDLSAYMENFYFHMPLLDEYIQHYKYNKLTNKIPEEFLNLVNIHAEKREFNYELPTRNEKFEKTDKKDAIVYFIDALGVEYLGYIMNKCKTLGLTAKISICRANLPSITSCNKDFLNGIEYFDVKDLDELKHSGNGDYNYQNSKLPIHIVKELEIIDTVLVKAKSKFLNSNKVIIASDHGASRLVVINERQYNFDVDSKGTHGGRCCKYTDDIQKVKYATEENGYYVLASYDRFKGGRAASVETHGGATLEEVVVPIIELTQTNNYLYVKFIETILTVSYKKKAELKLFSSQKLNNLTIKINEKFYDATQIDDHNYNISINDIKRIGNYYADILDNGNLIVEKMPFSIIKEGAVENELL